MISHLINIVEESFAEVERRAQRLEQSDNLLIDLLTCDLIETWHYLNESIKKYADHRQFESLENMIDAKDIKSRYYKLVNRFDNIFEQYENIIFGNLYRIDDPVLNISTSNFFEFYGIDGEDLYRWTVANIIQPAPFEINADNENLPGISSITFQGIKENAEKGLASIKKAIAEKRDIWETISLYSRSRTFSCLPNKQQFIHDLQKEFRIYSEANELDTKDKLCRLSVAARVRESRVRELTADDWSRIMDIEERTIHLAVTGSLSSDCQYNYLESERIKELERNKELLKAIINNRTDGKLFDISRSIDDVLKVLTSDNLTLFFDLILRHNLIQCEMFPNLRSEYKAWLKSQNSNNDIALTKEQQATVKRFLDWSDIIIWKTPADADKVKLIMRTLLGENKSLLEPSDENSVILMWVAIEKTRGKDGAAVVFQNILGRMKNYINGNIKNMCKEVFKDFDAKAPNNINKGASGNVNTHVEQVLTFIDKYIKKIINDQN